MCQESYKRYDDNPDAVFTICEEMWEDQEDVLLATLAKKAGNAVEKICVDAMDVCATSDLQ